MPQQINLCAPVLLTQKRYFSAQTLLQALAIFALFGGGLAAYGVWSLNTATRSLRATSDAQGPELARLRAAMVDSRSRSAPGDKSLDAELTALRSQLRERQATLAQLRRGLLAPGQGHSARLALVASSIPAPVWVTEIRADESQMEVVGFTQEPAALNDWVARLAQSPLLQGQQLARIKVERVVAPPTASAVQARLPWAFTLASRLPSSAGAAPGGQP